MFKRHNYEGFDFGLNSSQVHITDFVLEKQTSGYASILHDTLRMGELVLSFNTLIVRFIMCFAQGS